MSKHHLKFIFSLLAAVAVTAGLSLALQNTMAAWKEPTANPPLNNTYMPLYGTSTDEQVLDYIGSDTNALTVKGGSFRVEDKVSFLNGGLHVGGVPVSSTITFYDGSAHNGFNIKGLSFISTADPKITGFYMDDSMGNPNKMVTWREQNPGVDSNPGVDHDLYYTLGNVGIGVTNPTAKLEIGGISGTDGIKFPDATTQTTGMPNCVDNQYPVFNGGKLECYGGQAPGTGAGFFVRTLNTYTGDLVTEAANNYLYTGSDGMEAADFICLNEVNSNDFIDRPSLATVKYTASQVFAFLCNSSGCNNLLPDYPYEFAEMTAGTPHGGDSFTTDSLGVGPGDLLSWDNPNKFMQTDGQHWTGRGIGSNDKWSANASANTCSDWTNGGGTGRVGQTGHTDSQRWSRNDRPCSQGHKLICVVNDARPPIVPSNPPEQLEYFLTNNTYTGNLGGVTGANDKCNADLNATIGKTYKAVFNSPWGTPGKIYTNLIYGTGVNRTDNYSTFSPSFWVGRPSHDCNGWVDPTTSYDADVYQLATSDVIGTFSSSPGSSLCDNPNKILCVEQSSVNPSKWEENGSDIYYDAGKVGINTNTPNHNLTVRTDVAGPGLYLWGDGQNPELALGDGTNYWSVYSDETGTNDLRFWNSVANNNLLTITKDGKVGIGMTDPSAKLDVNGQIVGGFGAITTGGTQDWSDISNYRPGSGYTLLNGSDANGPGPTTLFHPFNFEYSSKNGSGNITQFAIPYGATSHMDSGIYMRGRYAGAWNNWRKILSENSLGNVGIGTNAPGARLHVTGGLYGVRGFGTSYGGYFGDTNNSGYAILGYGNTGIRAYGNAYGGYFRDLDSSGYAYVGYGDYGIDARGNTMGGYFADPGATGIARVGYSNYGIYAQGSYMAGRFIETDTGVYSYIGYSGYGLSTNGSIYSTGSVRGTSLCIGGSCKTSWPTLSYTNCAWTAEITANRPAWAKATCTGTKQLAGHRIRMSTNTHEDSEWEVGINYVKARRASDGTWARVAAYCCNVVAN